MYVVFLGPPGAGKGTQAARLALHYGIPHIATGDILRDIAKNSSPVGQTVARLLDAGKMVPDAILAELVIEGLPRAGALLDGFPRSAAQVAMADKLFQARGVTLRAAVELRVDPDVLVQRILARAQTALNEGKTPRSDDNELVFRTRYNEYVAQTAPISQLYEVRGLLRTIDGMNDIERVTSDIISALGDPA